MSYALLVLDIQKALFNTTLAPYEADVVIKRINQLSAKARAEGVPVVQVQTSIPGFLEYGSEGWQFCDALEVAETDIRIGKSSGDAFHETELKATLEGLGVEQLVVCGFATEICVDTTVRRATTLGYKVDLVADAHTTTDKAHLSAEKIREHHNLTLKMAPTIEAIDTADIAFSD